MVKIGVQESDGQKRQEMKARLEAFETDLDDQFYWSQDGVRVGLIQLVQILRKGL